MEGKRGPAQYNARKLMEGEEGEEGNGLLSQYDEEILGAKKKVCVWCVRTPAH